MNRVFLKLCHQTKALHTVLSRKKCINYGFDSPCGSSEKEHPADECLFFSRHVPTLVNNFYDNKKLQFFISDFSLPRVTQAAAKCTVLYYYLFLQFLTFLIKFMFSKKATKIDEIFNVDLTLCSRCQINGEEFVNFCGLHRKHEL